MINRKIKITYLVFSLLFFVFSVFYFGILQNSKQSESYTKTLIKKREYFRSNFSQDWIIGAISTAGNAKHSKPMHTVKNFARLVINDPYTYGQVFFYKNRAIDFLGNLPSGITQKNINLRDFKTGYSNISKSVVLRDSFTQNVDVLTFLENPRGYILSNGKAKAPLTLRNFQKGLPEAIFIFLVVNFFILLALYSYFLQSENEKAKNVDHDFRKLTRSDAAVSDELIDSKDDPTKILEISNRFASQAIVGKALLYRGADFKERKECLNDLVTTFCNAFFVKRNKSIFKLAPIDKSINVLINQTLFFKVLSNLMANSYEHTFGKPRQFFSLKVLESQNDVHLVITNPTKKSTEMFKKSIFKGVSSKNSSGRGLSIVNHHLKIMEQDLSILKVDNSTVQISFKIKKYLDQPWTIKGGIS